jgi:hypothetical protein
MAVHAEMLSFSIAAGAPDAAASLPPGPGAGERRAAGGREEQPVAAPAEMRYFRERERERERKRAPLKGAFIKANVQRVEIAVITTCIRGAAGVNVFPICDVTRVTRE